MDCKEEPDTGEEIVFVDTHILLVSDHEILYIVKSSFNTSLIWSNVFCDFPWKN